MELLATVTGVRGIRGNIVGAPGSSSKNSLTTGKDGQGSLTRGHRRGVGPSLARLSTIASPMAWLTTLETHTLRGSGQGGSCWGLGGWKLSVSKRRLGAGVVMRTQSKLLENSPHPLSQGGAGGRGAGGEDRRIGTKSNEQRFTKSVDPGSWRCGGQKLEEICLREGRGQLGTECGSLLGNAFKLATQAGNFVQRPSGGRVHIHGLGESLSNRVINTASNQFPSPKHLKCLVCRNAQSISESDASGGSINARGGPPSHKAGNVTRKFPRRDALAPSNERPLIESA